MDRRYRIDRQPDNIIDDNDLAHQIGYNNRAYEQPVTENTLYKTIDMGNYEIIDPEYQEI